MEKFSGFNFIEYSLEETDITACLQDSLQFLNPSHIFSDNPPTPPPPPPKKKKKITHLYVPLYVLMIRTYHRCHIFWFFTSVFFILSNSSFKDCFLVQRLIPYFN